MPAATGGNGLQVNPLYPFKDRLFLGALAAGPAGALVWVALTGERAGDDGLLAPWPLLMLVVVYPVLEELAFRGLVQGLLLRPRWGRYRAGPLSLANVLTTLAFAMSHWPRGSNLLALGVVPPGLIFGYFRERHDGLLSPVLLHGWYNLSVIALTAAWPA